VAEKAVVRVAVAVKVVVRGKVVVVAPQAEQKHRN
jgi:hypothetical protein